MRVLKDEIENKNLLNSKGEGSEGITERIYLLRLCICFASAAHSTQYWRGNK